MSRTTNTALSTPISIPSDSATDRSNRTRVNPVSGHAFAQPKARLGRPVPLSSQMSSQISQKASQSGVPSAGHSEIPQQGRSVSSSLRPQSTQGLAWNASGSVWQSGPTFDSTFANPADSIPGPAEVQNSGTIVSAQTSGPRSSEQIREKADELNIDAPDNRASTVVGQPVAPVEPTMLDRLRGLYNPRIDDNTDKLRKQIRRWPDPFGLLKDREEPAISGPENSPVPADADAQTADLDTTQPPLMTEVSTENSHILSAIQELEAELAAWPQKMSGEADRAAEWRQKQTDLRLLYLIAGKSAESVRIIESLPAEEQEFWQSLMMSMNSYRENPDDGDRTEQLTESLRHLRTASRKLQPLSRLTIQRSMLCDRIDGFGNVASFPTSVFEPGQRVLVYTELQNFQSELTEDGKYRSEFAARIEFMREGDDEILEKIQVLQIEDLCDVERTDYFQSFELTLPALEGKYRMRILLRDYLSQQVAESSLAFSIRSRSGNP